MRTIREDISQNKNRKAMKFRWTSWATRSWCLTLKQSPTTTEVQIAPALQQSRQTIQGTKTSINIPRGIFSCGCPLADPRIGGNEIIACSLIEASLLESMRRSQKEQSGNANNKNGNNLQSSLLKLEYYFQRI
jgi:hypothetical protein